MGASVTFPKYGNGAGCWNVAITLYSSYLGSLFPWFHELCLVILQYLFLENQINYFWGGLQEIRKHTLRK